ncbi:GrpB family protein [Rubrivirga marina]|uniref:GrpB family protein n=1 Tax=Rubrivirga marina TaxID=1196024 RepID=A0A271ITW5_9BACT|nr:hypothetical protein BSZ37_20525 [Rubrivirga marina]
MRAVQVLPYDPQWPVRFGATAAELRSALGPAAVAVHHVGSTAVPGLAAKPVVDVLGQRRDTCKMSSQRSRIAHTERRGCFQSPERAPSVPSVSEGPPSGTASGRP